MWTAVDSGLAEVDGFGAFRLQLLVEDEGAIEPEAGVALGWIFRPMDVHGKVVPFAD